jgi:putative FmdB family regulatory protein
MPTYEYECENGEECPTGGQFRVEQSIRDEKLATCPRCGGRVERLISPTYISSPTSDSDLRDKGFAKLVRKDTGVYENVTALDGESRVWEADKPETMPDIKRRVSD